MGCECVTANDQQAQQSPKKHGPVITSLYQPSETNSALGFDPYEIQDKIDKHMKWELDYYAWIQYKGDEAKRPPRPGPHPDPKHEWNTNPEKFETNEDTIADENSDFIWSQIDLQNSAYKLDVQANDDADNKSEKRQSKILFDL